MSTFISKENERAKKRVEGLVENYYDVSVEKLNSKIRGQEVARARHICFFLLKRDFDMHPSLIAALYKMDHSSVIHGLKRVKELKLYREVEKVSYPHFPLL